jgi:hypothetical protein
VENAGIEIINIELQKGSLPLLTYSYQRHYLLAVNQ